MGINYHHPCENAFRVWEGNERSSLLLEGDRYTHMPHMHLQAKDNLNWEITFWFQQSHCPMYGPCMYLIWWTHQILVFSVQLGFWRCILTWRNVPLRRNLVKCYPAYFQGAGIFWAEGSIYTTQSNNIKATIFIIIHILNTVCICGLRHF